MSDDTGFSYIKMGGPIVTIYPAPGALCGEHYIDMNHARLGTTQPTVNGWRTNLYHNIMYKPEELRALADAVTAFVAKKEGQ